VTYFDNETPALERLGALGIPTTVLETTDVNAVEVVEAARAADVDVLVYSGPGGAILRADLLGTGKRFLHVHPGALPGFRGSTTVYYSLLAEGTCAASALFLDERIDTGPMLATAAYPPPEDRSTIDYGYDPYIRADLLVRVLRDYVERGSFEPRPQPAGPGETYYIMHPVLRHVAVLSRR
jgi:methionyl-tRNA formyltransferase